MTQSNLFKTYGKKTALHIQRLTLPPGAITAVIGANGSGKSTLLKLLAGIEKPDAPFPPGTDAPPLTGYMPQRSHGFKISLWHNLLLGLKPTPENRRKAEELLSALGLTALRNTRADRLSGGETQKTALARLLMRPCGLLLLDEPTSAMDAPSTVAAEGLIRDYCRQTPCTVLMATHSLKQAQRLSDSLIVLDEGAIAEQGPTREVLSAPESERTRRFLEFGGG